jgi:hypothetical protein
MIEYYGISISATTSTPLSIEFEKQKGPIGCDLYCTYYFYSALLIFVRPKSMLYDEIFERYPFKSTKYSV